VHDLVRSGFSRNEALDIEVKRARWLTLRAKVDSMTFQAELLSAQGISVFGREKGIERYRETFEAFKRLSDPEEETIPVKIEAEEFIDG
jgi:hypothetical protein